LKKLQTSENTAAERVKAFRERLQWSQQELATAMGFARNYISQVELGREPGKRFLQAMLTCEQLHSPVVSNLPMAGMDIEDFRPVRYGDSPRERLQQALAGKKLTPAGLAKKIKYDAGIVENVVNGSGRISEAMAEKIVAALDGGLTVAELLDGSDTPRIMDATGLRGTHGAKATVQLPGASPTRMVPLISWAAAGSLAGAAALDEDFASDAVASTVPGRAFAVEISGDSMYPKIEPGDYVVVRADAVPRPGQVVLVRTIHGDVLCKRYTTRDGNRLVILSSINKSYEPIEIPASEIAWIYPVQQMIRNSNNL
jgi:SOS-response transcriptional repressor LexA/DNA-binding XRE family transcriptional regulator